ncbi:ABC transporter ATP-binding protein [Limnothrix sp. FACHB-881]|uniref:ABC transporter ATP-binding protein n=1 Tax=unclassified Limnothrix TaxID=2632864 RepID=UPI0016833373|nr:MULTISPECIES: ABC transporter ATP-binding protein [unclassified Limnothrix]MBD2551666.1 ABC transporter ATP-binding protein [Limnothrix sp. FACHB-708]MBD2591369.1 ABC transporter ATP-binding protein [Limnothrix sp. FACHB-406]MBD2634525.1 ABC transporter ATP-binding protein [Limnothrix sp. FACHB-881]
MITLQNITKTYQLGETSVPILKGIDLDIPANDYLAIVGSSGSGKSTLMNIIGCLDRPTEGTYTFENRNLTALNSTELAYIRNQRIGFVFQQFNLLPRATALENVMLPAVYAGIPKADRRARAEAALVSVGLGDRLHNRPNQLSGGQQQRVAIARALINQPSLLLADEPTGALDSQTTQEVMNLFDQLHQQQIAIVLITHDLAIADRTQRKIQIRDGLIVD